MEEALVLNNKRMIEQDSELGYMKSAIHGDSILGTGVPSVVQTDEPTEPANPSTVTDISRSFQQALAAMQQQNKEFMAEVLSNKTSRGSQGPPTKKNVDYWRRWDKYCYTCGVNLNHNSDNCPADDGRLHLFLDPGAPIRRLDTLYVRGRRSGYPR
jgi:hypothetical protein